MFRDERILNRIASGINNQKARQKLFEEGDLQLANAVKIIEAAEGIRETEMNFWTRMSRLFKEKQKVPLLQKKAITRTRQCAFTEVISANPSI